MLSLYTDINVDGALTRALRSHGVDVITAQEDGGHGKPDVAILNRALSWADCSLPRIRTFSLRRPNDSEVMSRSAASFFLCNWIMQSMFGYKTFY